MLRRFIISFFFSFFLFCILFEIIISQQEPQFFLAKKKKKKKLRRSVFPRSPRSSAWNVTPSKLKTATTLSASLGFKGDRRIEFLCAKDVDNAAAPVEQFKNNFATDPHKARFDLITAPPNKEWEDRQDTLHGIVGLKTRKKRARDEKTIPRKISFAAFCKKHPEWANRNSSFVFFRDHPHFLGRNVLIQREQIFGTCAIHAPVVLQHYVVAMANRGATPTVDIPKWLRKHAPSAVLEGVVFGKGTFADQVLEAVLARDSTGFLHIDMAAFSSIPRVLGDYGPVLLPNWAVRRDFRDAAKWAHSGAGTAKTGEHHAMLAIGHRRCKKSGKTHLLLQNWWRHKQFVEVDEDYYNSCMVSSARFVTTPQPHIPPQLDTTNAVFSVSTVDGAGVAGVGCGPAGLLTL